MPNTKEKLIEKIDPILKSLPWGQITPNTAEDIADRLIEEGVTFVKDNNVPSKWISVKDRLPEIASKHKDRWGWHNDSVRVLCVCVQKDGKTMVKEGYLRDWGGDARRWMIPGTIDSVTHWMPLPPAPKGE